MPDAPEVQLDRYFAAVREVAGRSPSGFAPYLERLFAGVELEGKAVLDVGGGSGLYSFYAAARGARSVVCLEPEAEGAAAGTERRFRELASRLGAGQVALCQSPLQELDGDSGTFDVVLLHNSVNHLDEAACIALGSVPEARATYEGICRKLAGLTSPGGRLILADCSRHNLFRILRRPNPFAPTIEWENHHRPRVWVELLREAGFSNPEVTWPVPYGLRGLRRSLLDNELASFFLSSHFWIKMERG